MSTAVTFNGYDLTQNFVVSNLSRPLLVRTPQTIEVPGRDGQLYTATYLDPIEITMELATLSNDEQEISNAFRTLALALNVSEPSQLAISDDDGKYYLAIPYGAEIERWIGAQKVPITFYCPDPAMYGETKTVTVPSGGAVTFDVGGNTYTYPSFTASATRDSTSLLWSVRLDGGDFIQVATGSTSAVSVECDCKKRTLKVGNTQTLPTLTSDWFVLAPGTHVLQNDVGTGAATFTYTERWL